MSEQDLPERIGPYRVVDRLGEGGMGTVYTGLDADGNKVAIKVIKRAFADDRRYRARFEAEVAAAQRVRPFCTAPVLDADPAADRPYLVTEYVDGPSLKDVVAENGRLRGADLEAVAVGIATALTAVHDAGIVHRDLKPANVLLSTFGPRVIDFGIARSLDGAKITTTGGIVGSPAFMAPEQLDGRAAVPASDVFAWGATVAFAARGEPCFGGDSIPAVIMRIVSGEPDLSGLDGALLAAVRAALAKDPDRRPSAQSLLERLISGGVRRSAAEDTVPPAAPETVPTPVAARRTPSRTPSPALADGEAEALVERQYRQAAETGDPAAMRNLAALLGGRGRAAEAETWNRYADAVDARPAAYRRPSGDGYAVPPPSPPPEARRHTQAPARPRPSGPPLNTLAVVSMILGVASPFTCGLLAIPAIVTGHAAWKRVSASGGRGGGYAITGLVLGWSVLTVVTFLGLGLLLPEGQ